MRRPRRKDSRDSGLPIREGPVRPLPAQGETTGFRAAAGISEAPAANCVFCRKFAIADTRWAACSAETENDMREKMVALTQSIVSSSRERQMAVADGKQQTAKMLRAFHRERAAMAKASKSSLVADRVSRSVEVCALLADACTQRADFAKAHHHMARAQCTGLAKARRNRSRDVAELINGFYRSRSEMARKLSDSLTRATQDIRSHVSGLREWHTVSIQRGREDALMLRQIPSYLLPAGGARTTRVSSSVRSHEPERHPEKTSKEKMPVAKAIPASGRVTAKPKKR